MVEATLGLAAVVVAVTGFAAIGTWYARAGDDSLEGFLVARDSVGGARLAATVFASSMGAWILFSPAEAGAAAGGLPAVVGYAVGSALPLLAFAVAGPTIRSSLPRGRSITEYARARFGALAGTYVLLVSAAYMAVFLAAEMTGVATAMALLADVPAWQTAGLLSAGVLAYTGAGGLRASVATDAVQTALVVPLLAVVGAGGLAWVGGPAALDSVATSRPDLLDLANADGLRFGVYVSVAVFGAELLNQAWWQRVYAASDDRALRRAFLAGGVAVVPAVGLAGLLGLLAEGLGHVPAGSESTALFALVDAAFPAWAALGVGVVALVLVMSTADTLFSALASLVTVDLPRVVDTSDDHLLAVARASTAVVAVAAAVVGARGYSVLTLFLAADLLAVATVVPLFAGLYTPRLGGAGMVVACASGLAVGAVLFPPLGVYAGASFLWSFLGAAAVSAAVAGLAAWRGPGGRSPADLGEHWTPDDRR